MLEWQKSDGKTAVVDIDPKKLPGVVIDDAQATLTGKWSPNDHSHPFVGAGYHHDNNTKKGQLSARFEARLPTAGRYEVRLAYTPNPNRATNIPVTIHHAAGDTTLTLNQQTQPPIDNLWTSLGTFDFTPNEPATVTISNKDTNGHVILDAVQFLPK